MYKFLFKKILATSGSMLIIINHEFPDDLKDQTMDERLSYIRRASGLEARHSFFVLSLSQHGDLQDFVTKYVRFLVI